MRSAQFSQTKKRKRMRLFVDCVWLSRNTIFCSWMRLDAQRKKRKRSYRVWRLAFGTLKDDFTCITRNPRLGIQNHKYEGLQNGHHFHLLKTKRSRKLHIHMADVIRWHLNRWKYFLAWLLFEEDFFCLCENIKQSNCLSTLREQLNFFHFLNTF